MSYTKKPSVVKIDPTVTHLQPDQFDNDEPIQSYPFGPSAMRVTTATGFPETSGDVITSRTTDGTGSQIFVGEKAYIRTFETDAWSSWRELGSVSGVTSVNGKTGDVVLTAEDVGAETPDGAQTKADQAEQNAKDYTDQEVSKAQDDFDAHKAESTQNAHLAKNIGIEDTEGNFTATDVEGALEELFTSVSDGKIQIASAITDKGVPASGSDTFAQLATKIGQISTGRKWASGLTTSPSTTPIIIDVNGLAFKPSAVFVWFDGDVNTSRRFNFGALFDGDLFEIAIYDPSLGARSNAKYLTLYYASGPAGQMFTNMHGSSQIRNDGFTFEALFNEAFFSNKPWSWICFE